MFYETGARDKSLLPNDPFKAIVAPRPIGWISTRAPDGRINLAPYSFFNAFSSVPPLVGFSSEGYKDSATFAVESGEFVANLASFDLMRPMSLFESGHSTGEVSLAALLRGEDQKAKRTAMTVPGLIDRKSVV